MSTAVLGSRTSQWTTTYHCIHRAPVTHISQLISIHLMEVDCFALRSCSSFSDVTCPLPLELAYFSIVSLTFFRWIIYILLILYRELKYNKCDRKTTHIFIDEAAQASEPAALVPVCGLLARGGALVLAGDPRQLGPICISMEAKAQGLGTCETKRRRSQRCWCGCIGVRRDRFLPVGNPRQLGPVWISGESSVY